MDAVIFSIINLIGESYNLNHLISDLMIENRLYMNVNVTHSTKYYLLFLF